MTPSIVEGFLDAAFNKNIPLVYMIKGDSYCCMTLSMDLSKQSHRELAFWSIVQHAFKYGSECMALVLPCWFDVQSSSLSLSYEANDKNSQGYPVLTALSVDQEMNVSDGVYFKVFKGSFESSVFPSTSIPDESLASLKEQLGIKLISSSDSRLEKSSISIAEPLWSPLFEDTPVLH